MWSRHNKVIDFGKDCNVLLFSTTMFYFHLKWGCTSCLKDASHKCCFEVVIFRIFVIYCTSTCIFIQLEAKQINKQTLLEPTSTYKSNVKSTVIDIWKRCVKKYCSCDKACQFQLYRVHLDGVILENLEFDDKFVNKRVRLFIHQTMRFSHQTCWEKKLLGRHNKCISLKIAFVK